MKTLADFRNLHRDESIFVCGLGPSIHWFDPGKLASVGVNDIGKYFHPSYLVCVNSKPCFSDERWFWIERSLAKYIFTDRNLNTFNSRVIRFRLGKFQGISWDDVSLPYAEDSTYIALALAAFMGAKNIGLIGVDFTNHPHLGAQIANIDAYYKRFGAALAERNINVYNLSEGSALTCLPRLSVEEFKKL